MSSSRFFIEDDHAPRVRHWARSAQNIALSAWTLTEATSALSMQVRMKHITDAERGALEDRLDTWARRSRIVAFELACLDDARRLLRRHSRLRVLRPVSSRSLPGTVLISQLWMAF